jgi:hypothetical protein
MCNGTSGFDSSDVLVLPDLVTTRNASPRLSCKLSGLFRFEFESAFTVLKLGLMISDW